MSDETRILYNGECPVCSFEIGNYADYAKAKALPLRFEDLNAAALEEWGLTQDQAARRLYLLKDGQMLSGIPAFIVLWQEMPRYRRLARLVSLPGLHWLASKTYDYILAPLIYNWDRRRRTRKSQAETNC